MDASTHLLTLPSQPFPQSRYPGLLAYVPPGFDPNAPLDIVLYFRGFSSCVSAVAASVPTPCTEGGRNHRPSALIEQFNTARVNALLLLPELRFEAASGDPGQLAQRGNLVRLLDETLRALAPALGVSKSAADVQSLILMAHSGGFAATAAVMAHGEMLDRVRQVVLFDAFYGGMSTFEPFALRVARGEIPGGRFSTLSTGGAPSSNSAALAQRLRAANVPDGSVRVVTSGGLPTAQDWAALVLVKRVALEHSDVPRRLFGAAVETAGLVRI